MANGRQFGGPSADTNRLKAKATSNVILRGGPKAYYTERSSRFYYNSVRVENSTERPKAGYAKVFNCYLMIVMKKVVAQFFRTLTCFLMGKMFNI